MLVLCRWGSPEQAPLAPHTANSPAFLVAPTMLSKEERAEKLKQALAKVGSLASRAELKEKADKVTILQASRNYGRIEAEQRLASLDSYGRHKSFWIESGFLDRIWSFWIESGFLDRIWKLMEIG